MSVAQVLEQVQQFSAEEIAELIDALEQEQLRKYNLRAAQRWAGKTFEMQVPTEFSEPPFPFEELVGTKE
jgi:signal transduction histidine kinase